MWHDWTRSVLCNAAFFELLLGIDRDLLDEAWNEPCHRVARNSSTLQVQRPESSAC